jgi:hypothetical protein
MGWRQSPQKDDGEHRNPAVAKDGLRDLRNGEITAPAKKRLGHTSPFPQNCRIRGKDFVDAHHATGKGTSEKPQFTEKNEKSPFAACDAASRYISNLRSAPFLR